MFSSYNEAKFLFDLQSEIVSSDYSELQESVDELPRVCNRVGNSTVRKALSRELTQLENDRAGRQMKKHWNGDTYPRRDSLLWVASRFEGLQEALEQRGVKNYDPVITDPLDKLAVVRHFLRTAFGVWVGGQKRVVRGKQVGFTEETKDLAWNTFIRLEDLETAIINEVNDEIEGVRYYV